MKYFQILDGYCHWDATSVVPNLEYAKEFYAPDIVFVEAPDYVREGWKYDPDLEGDQRFINPSPTTDDSPLDQRLSISELFMSTIEQI